MNMAMDHERVAPVLRLLERTAMEHLRGVVEDALQKADDHLFDLGTDHALHALRVLRRSREDIVNGYLGAFRQELDVIHHGQPPVPIREEAPVQEEETVLSLMSEDTLEDRLARDQLVRGLERHVVPQADIFQHRLQKLLNAEFDAIANPFGLAKLAHYMNLALSNLDLTLDTRLSLYKFLERALQTRLQLMYERLNAHLATAGVGSMVQDAVRRCQREHTAEGGGGGGGSKGRGGVAGVGPPLQVIRQ